MDHDVTKFSSEKESSEISMLPLAVLPRESISAKLKCHNITIYITIISGISGTEVHLSPAQPDGA